MPPRLEERVEVRAALGHVARHRVARVGLAGIDLALRVDEHEQRLAGERPLIDQKTVLG
jgi:hypothetical protein